MLYSDKYIDDYISLEKKKESVRNSLRFIFMCILQKFMQSEVYDRLQLLNIVDKPVEIKDLWETLGFLHIDNMCFVEHGDKTIDFNVTLSTKVLNQNIDVFINYLSNVLKGMSFLNIDKEVYYNIYFNENCKYINVDYSMLYVFGYRKLDLSTFIIRNKPYYMLFRYEQLIDSQNLYVDSKLIQGSVLVLYYDDIVRFYASLESLFFCYYAEKLLLHVKLDSIRVSELLCVLDKLKDRHNLSVYFDIKNLSGICTGWVKLLIKLFRLRNHNIKVYFKAAYVDM